MLHTQKAGRNAKLRLDPLNRGLTNHAPTDLGKRMLVRTEAATAAGRRKTTGADTGSAKAVRTRRELLRAGKH
jgi:hypothetical protein